MRKSSFSLSSALVLSFTLFFSCGSLLPAHSVAQDFSAQEKSRYETEAGEVTIVRDKWGIPHIYGKTDADVVFGLMYAECQTDFSRVEKNYLEMLGRQSEVYGENYLYTDVMMRLIYDSTQAMADYEKSPSWMHKLLDAFADGVNYYLYKHPETKPQALHHFEPWYALMFTDGSVSATSTGGVRMDEIRNFYGKGGAITGALGDWIKRKPSSQTAGVVPSVSAVERMVLADRGIGLSDPDAGMNPSAHSAPSDNPRSNSSPADNPHAHPGAPLFDGSQDDEWQQERGSNGFALADFRVASGGTELYINPHVPFYFRLEVQLVSEEGLNTYGAVTWGQFFVYQGFNAHCGWMHTSSVADVADLYEEKTHQQDSGWVYDYEGKTRPVTTKSFTVYYKKNDDCVAFPVTGYYTHHGPVMASRNGKWLSLKEYNRSLNALLEAWQITKAGTFEEYKKAMEIRANTTNNTVYADDQGNIAYWHGNFMPRRDTTYDWSLPVDGSIAATEWKGVHELDEIVHVYNPATGWIQNCNSTPFTISGGSSPERRKYPVYMAPDGENFRALNAARLLSGASDFTLDSLIAKGYDRYLAAFDVLLPSLFDAYTASPDSVKRAIAAPIALLQKWDRKSAIHSVPTTLAVEWAARMVQYAPRPRVPEEATNAVGNIQAEVDQSTPQQKTAELMAVMKELQQRYGNWKMEWGDICRYQRLTGKITETYDDKQQSLPSGLVSSAVGALPSFASRVMPNTKKRYGYSGNSFICAVEFGKRVKAKTIVTGGESSDPASPHFSDQASMYLGGWFKEVLFYPEDVSKNTEKKYHPGAE
ncbi:MAG TPA: penicillin acylase family protein [Puia sp.]|nr:penicillin acylase family protein [Puia sp.]